VRNCLTDEGRPLGTGLQERVPNHLRRLWSKAMVVNAEGKGLEITESGDRQEEDRKGTTDEVSKVRDDSQNRGVVVAAGRAPTTPVYGRSGIRHERWPELAMRQLNGTWNLNFDANGEATSGSTTRARVRMRSSERTAL
jgi:hypothetical protein